jgi:hypothetical protein
MRGVGGICIRDEAPGGRQAVHSQGFVVRKGGVVQGESLVQPGGEQIDRGSVPHLHKGPNHVSVKGPFCLDEMVGPGYGIR